MKRDITLSEEKFVMPIQWLDLLRSWDKNMNAQVTYSLAKIANIFIELVAPCFTTQLYCVAIKSLVIWLSNCFEESQNPELIKHC